MQSVGIIGLGLLGGSLGMALKGSFHRIGWAAVKITVRRLWSWML